MGASLKFHPDEFAMVDNRPADEIAERETKMSECTCPVIKPHNYGQSWAISHDFKEMTCASCGGTPRAEQSAEITEGLRIAALQLLTPREDWDKIV